MFPRVCRVAALAEWILGSTGIALLLLPCAVPAQSTLPPYGLVREVWEGLPGGGAVSELTNSADYPSRPTSTSFVTEFFEAPTDVLDDYGQRLHGYLVPPVSGAYRFWIASDDGGALFLSTDENPANGRQVASVNSWTSSREWTKEANQESAPITLAAGRAYYVSALMKEGGGGDNLAVRWLRPDGVDEAPIVGTNLLPWGVSFSAPVVATPPASVTVVEGGTATFTVQLAATGSVTYQWRRNGASIAGATAPSLVLAPVGFADDGARFSVFVTNRQGSALSTEATLTVTPDLVPPTIVAVENVGTDLVRVRFSEALATSSVTQPGQYALFPVVPILAARPGSDASIVELVVDRLVYGVSYQLTVSDVTDQARTPNRIANGASVSFRAYEYTPATVGNPGLVGDAVPVPGGVFVMGAGTLGGRGDVFQFAYQPVTGDFDRAARIATFQPTDPYAASGLMARASLATNSVVAAALTTPAQLGSYFLTRSVASAEATTTGRFPAHLPDAWLRLRRRGNVFEGYASLDGRTWTLLGSATVTMPATVFFGLAASSRDPAQTAAVTFLDIGAPVGTAVAPVPPRVAETAGPSSRGSGLVISEIMYHPLERADGRNGEFVEIRNSDLIDRDLTGYRLAGDAGFDFPKGFVLPAGGHLVVARVPSDLDVIHGGVGALGPFRGTNNLPNGGGTLRLLNGAGSVMVEVTYDNRAPWPVSPDGGGHSLVLARPSYGEEDARAWRASDRVGGSPGTAEVFRPFPESNIVFNEVLAHTDLPQVDFLELYNHGNDAVDLSGCILTDDPSTNRFRIPDGTRITPRGFVAFDENQLGFRLSAAGETLFLVSSNRARVIDAVRFGPQENGVSSGRYPDGTPEWRRLRQPTFADGNAPFRVSPVVINEIMHAPISRNDDDEFVELHNRTDATVDLSGWSFTDGIDFRFPAGTTLAARGYLVVARNRDHLLSRQPGLAPAAVFGDYAGSLANGGERLALAFRDFIVSTNASGIVSTNRIDIDIDEVTYGSGGRWPIWTDELGSSLELIDPNSDHLRPSNWAASDETSKATWTTVDFTGRVDNQALTASRLHLVAQGPGEYLIDDLQILGHDGTPRLANGDFSGGLTGWTAQGNHRATVLSETGGVGGSRALHVRTTGRGDTAVNRVRAPLSPNLSVNVNATIRAKIRWLKGWPEFLLRTLGSGIEAPARLDIPGNLGTPGAPNSRRVENAGPAVVDVRHAPPVPRANEAVVVTARVTDPDAVQSVTLRYRLDPATTLSSLAMRDDGTGGDAVAGDGIYSSTLPGRAANTLVAFRIEAADGHPTAPATSLFPPTAPALEALIRWEAEFPVGTVGLYRFWQRSADFNRLRSRERLANDNLDCTFVYGDERVIYNAEMRGKGSPFHGGSVGGDYLFAMPDDDRLLGARDMAIVTLGNLGSDPSAQREQGAFWIGEQLGVPYLHRRHVRFYENGAFKGLYEDTEEPNGLYVDRRFPEGPDGDLFKIEDWFEFNDAGDSFPFSRDATLERFTSNGELKLARYRWAWRKRAVVDSANDYSRFFQLVQAVNGPVASYAAPVDNFADVESWMRTFALQHIVGNWDAYGYNRGKNSYLYLPRDGRWKIIPWDIDFVLGSGSDGPTTDVFSSNDPVVRKLWETPVFRRMYWRAFQDAVNGPLLESAIGPVLDARHAALVANGFTTIERTAPIKTWVNQRRNYLAGRVRSEDVASLDITSNGGAGFSTNRNLATLAGTAPIAVATLEVNGLPFPVTWTSVNTWSLSVPLAAATNVLQIVGRDLRGQPVPGAADTITVRYTGTLPEPDAFLVLNEIHYDPAQSGSGFVEIHNTSATASFDLSGWRLDGAGFTFPSGSVLRPGGFLVVASDLAGFRAAFGTALIPVGQFDGNLQNDGETLRLVRPGATPAQDRIIDEVRYDSAAPWPVTPRGLGPSLQLLDPLQDNRRVANWGAAPTNSFPLATPGAANSLRTSLPAFPTLWLNEVQPVNLAGPTDARGDRDPWIELHNPGSSPVDLSGLYLASSVTNTLTEWAFPAGTVLAAGQFLVVWCDGEPSETTASELHASFRLAPTNGVVALVWLQGGAPAVLDALRYRDLPAGKAWGSFPDADPLRRQFIHLPTPGAANRPGAPDTPVVINEWMASNLGAVRDPADDDPDDWFELHNPGFLPADLSAFTLTDDLARPDKFRIPNGTVIPPGGYLIVWADEETGQTAPGHLHVNFRLAGSGESLGLFGPDGTRIDAVTFGSQTDNAASGRFPDGGPEPFVLLDFPTPARPNVFGSVNQPPVLAPVAPRTEDEGAVVTFRATATDPDAGQRLRFSLVAAPPGATIDAATGDFRWATTEPDGPGTYAFQVMVTDDGQPARFDTEIVRIEIRELNQPPVLAAIPEQTIDERRALTFTVAGSDPDLPRQNLAYSIASGRPDGAFLHPTTGEFTWTPTEAQGPGTYTLLIAVSDSQTPDLVAVREARIVVRETDDAPVFDAVSLQAIPEGTSLRLQLVARDPDQPPATLAYVLESGPSGATVDPVTGVFAWTPGETAGPGSFNVVVRANQIGGGPSGTTSFSVVVDEKNEVPVLGGLRDFDVPEGSLVTFTATANDTDLPAQRLVFTLDPGAPSGASIDPQTGIFSWPIPDDAGASTNTIIVRVADNGPGALATGGTFQVVVRPRVRIAIHEIHYRPAVAGAEFVELHNASTRTTWDLAGWRLRGAFETTFGPDTRLGPTNYLVVVARRDAFTAAFPRSANANLVVGTPRFTASGPQHLVLERPIGDAWETVSEVAFERGAPWPAAADSGTASLQLLDARQDTRRVANWAAQVGATTNAPRNLVTLTNLWRYKQDVAAPAGWQDTSFNDATWLSGRGLLYVEDAALPAPKTTALVRTAGRMTYYFRARFTFDGNPDGASLLLNTVVDDGYVLYLNGRELHRLGVPDGTVTDETAANRTVGDAILEGPVTLPATNLLVGNNVLAVEVHQVNATSSDIVWGASLDVLEVRRDPATPGFANSVRATLAPFPDVWVHEVLPRNSTGPTDNAGDREPWIELANLGNTPADLAGWWLTDDLNNLAKWPLPAGATLAPRSFQLVWADAETAESTATQWHASFRLPAPRGIVALSREQNGRPAVIDYLAYDVPGDDQSVGVLDSANPLLRGKLPSPTPGLPNAANRPPTFDAVPDQTATVGQPLVLDLVARDPDIGQRLAYELASGAPAGAALDRVTGRFTWTPAAGQIGTHPVTVLVSDDGTPRLGVQGTFQVVVRPSGGIDLRFTEITQVSPTQIRLAWVSVPGRRYQLERRETLDAAWVNLGLPVTAVANTTGFVLVPSPGIATSFFRVRLVE